MKLYARQLSGHLARELAPVYLVTGDEPLLVAEALEEIRARARRDGFDQREHFVVERGFKWEALAGNVDNLSLFATRRIIELRMPTPRPGDDGRRCIRALVERPDPDRLLLIATTKLDAAASRSAWVKSIEEYGALVQVWPIERPDLPKWIRQRASVAGLDLSQPAAELLADRVEGNLLAADQEIQKLVLLLGKGRVDEQAVLDAVASNTRFDVFRLTDAVLSADAVRAMRILDGLRTEGVEPALISWAISRELCLLARLKTAIVGGESEDGSLNRNRVWRRRHPLLKRALRRFEPGQLTTLVVRASEVDSIIKGVVRGSAWDELTRLVMAALGPGELQARRAQWRAA